MNLLKIIFPPKRKIAFNSIEEDLEQLSGSQMDNILGGKPILTEEYELVRRSGRDATPVSDLIGKKAE